MLKIIEEYEQRERIKNLYPEEIMNIIIGYEPKRMIRYIQKMYSKWNWERTYKQMYNKESIEIAQFSDNKVNNKWLNGLINRTSIIIVDAIDYKMKLKNGEVWATGNNEYGQLGIGNYENQNKWVKSNIKEKVIKIVCGGYNTMVLTEKGEVWATGYNEAGQLGIRYKAVS